MWSLSASTAELTGQISKIIDGDTFDLAGETIRRGVVCDWKRYSGGHYSRDGNGRPCPQIRSIRQRL